MPKIVNPEKKRQFIARAACRVIARKGIAGTTMQDIATEAGVTTGMITNYYSQKTDIITAALQIPYDNLERRLTRKIEQGREDLASLLEEVIPTGKRHYEDSAVWVNFWGLLASDRELRRLNSKLHKQWIQVYSRALHAAWPEAQHWSEALVERTLRAIITFVFGLSAGGITNPRVWSAEIQRDQLRLHLEALRHWANAQNSEGRK